jgi:ceramide glucosyltransferase
VILADFAAVLAGIGVVQAAAGAVLVARFAGQSPSPAERERSGEGRAGGPRYRHPALSRLAGEEEWPPITVLKPLHGDEPLLEQALASVCTQDYPEFQVVFGVQDVADTALPVVARLRRRFPTCDIAVVVDPTRHGANGKVSNLINMLPRAKHAVLVIADSDLHVQPDYLARLAEALATRGTGLVTTLYTGLPAARRLAQLLGATQITHSFLPGAVLARAMGRQDCLGATMVLRRATLALVGGLDALVNHLADDQVLGRRVAALGMAVRLAATVPATTVPEARLRDLLRHELRWARTIRALEPAAFAASVLQYPLFWGALAVVLSGGTAWSFGVFFIAWVGRALAAVVVDRALDPLLGVTNDYPGAVRRSQPSLDGDDGAIPEVFPGAGARSPDDLRLSDGAKLSDAAPQGLAFPCPVWLLPLRDLISVGELLASYAGRRVEWRGHHLTADSPGRPAPGLTAPD